jgi:RNA polymerase sigma-70 factor (ECF subfamily)
MSPPLPTALDDPDTLALARSGDRAAMHRLYAETNPVVTRFVARRVPPGQVEDLVAETYARALEALHRYQDRGIPLRAWLLRIALNLVIDIQRSGSGRTVPSAAIVEQAERSRPGYLADPATEWADRHDTRTTLRAAFAALAPAQRTAVGLRHLEGLPVGEVAAVLGVSEEAVRALTHRGLTALRRALAAPEEGSWT